MIMWPVAIISLKTTWNRKQPNAKWRCSALLFSSHHYCVIVPIGTRIQERSQAWDSVFSRDLTTSSARSQPQSLRACSFKMALPSLTEIMPSDLLDKILGYLEPVCLAAVSCTCREMRSMGGREEVWKRHCEKQWQFRDTLLWKHFSPLGKYKQLYASKFQVHPLHCLKLSACIYSNDSLTL